MKRKPEFFLAVLLIVLLASCATGKYMEMKPAERTEILGTVQTVFYISGSYRYRSTVNTQAYISLLAEAQIKYPDYNVDIRDIIWAIGKGDPSGNNYEYTAIGKVIKMPGR